MFDNSLAWYYQIWCWVGLGGAITILILLFATDFLRNDKTKSKWKDPTWLSWLAAMAYLLHNVEEYGLDLTGAMYGFPKGISNMLGIMPGGVFFAAVNISMFWFAGPIVAYLSRKNRVISVGIASFTFINMVIHIVPFIATKSYNAGLLTSILIFLPVTLWIFHVNFGKGKLGYSTLAVLFLIGVIGHGVLFGSILGLYRPGLAGDTLIALIQVFNAVLMVSLWYGSGKIAGGKLAEIKAR